jgi:O-antigen/teichoic acid export membrane protein
MQSEILRLAGHTLTYGAGQVITRMLSILLLPLFTAYLTPADYGISAMLGLIAFVVTPVFSLGLGAVIGVYYFQSEDSARRRRVIWTGFMMLVASSVLVISLGIVFGRQISMLAFRTPVHADLVVLSLLGTCFSILVTPLMLALQFENRSRAYVILSSCGTLAGLIAALVLVVGMRRGVHGFIEGIAIGQFVTFAAFFAATLRHGRGGLDLSLAGRLLKLGMAFVPSFIWVFVLQHGNKYILERSTDVTTLGIYTVGFNLGMVISIVVSGFQNAWMPYFMSFVTRREEARLVFARVMTYYVLGFGLISLFFFAGARAVVITLTQAPFEGAYFVVGSSAAAQFLIGVFSILLPAMYFADDVKYVSVLQAVAAVVAAVINFAAIRAFGLIGASAGLVLGCLALPVVQYVWNRMHSDYLQPPYEWGRLARFAAFYVVFAVTMTLRRDVSLPTEMVLAGAASLAATAVVLVILTKDERGALLGQLGITLSSIRRLCGQHVQPSKRLM